MFKVEEVIGIKLDNGTYRPLELLDDIIWLSPAAYNDTIKKLGRIYLALKEENGEVIDIDIDEKMADNPDFWEVLKPIVTKIVDQFSNLEISDTETFFETLCHINGFGSFALNLEDFTIKKLDFFEGTKTGIKITADSGESIYSFDARDRDDFGRMRVR